MRHRAAPAALAGAGAAEEQLFSDDPPGTFKPMPRVVAGSWLAEHKESGQTLKQFGRVVPCSRPHAYFTTLYIVPFGNFDPVCSPNLSQLAAYAGVFFGCRVAVLDTVPLSKVSTHARVGMDGQKQILATDILEYLDSFCIVGVTMTDIYPRPEWNFLFGLARADDGVGVFSFARYDPDDLFFSTETRRELTPPERALLMKRCCKVFTHETCHLYGMRHCIAYSCLMNGSNHLEESDAKPMHLCPLCLSKLRIGTKDGPTIDFVARYAALAAACVDMGLADTADSDTVWFRRRHELLNSGSGK